MDVPNRARFRKRVRSGKTGSSPSLNEGMPCSLSYCHHGNLANCEPYRFANLWLLVGCVVCVKNGNICDASQSYRTLSLPSPKSLWEAPTQFTWESEYEACRNLQTSGLVTLGDLIDAQHSAYTPSNARKLDKWNAEVDNLGCLLNLVGTMA